MCDSVAGPYVRSVESGIPEEVGSPPSTILWSPHAASTPGGSPSDSFASSAHKNVLQPYLAVSTVVLFLCIIKRWIGAICETLLFSPCWILLSAFEGVCDRYQFLIRTGGYDCVHCRMTSLIWRGVPAGMRCPSVDSPPALQALWGPTCPASPWTSAPKHTSR